MKITIIQPDLVWEDKTSNLDRLADIISQMRHETDLIILPEMFSTGFSMNTALSENYRGRTFDWMKQQASDGEFGICGSYMVMDNGNVYNRFVFVTAGEDYYYDKRHLFSIGEEDKFFEKGTSRTILSYMDWRISPFI